MRVRKEDVQAPKLPEEEVPVPELGGEVLVRGLSLGARLTLSHQFTATPGKKADFKHLAPLLALTVFDADDKLLFTEAEWEAWGAENLTSALRLWDVAWRLSDLDGEAASKNSKAPFFSWLLRWR